MKTICIKAVISGKVQGVFYRQNTLQKAQSLNLTGWVRNNDDDTVELHACGAEENIKNLVEWLWQGPPRAQVTQVDWSEIPEEKHAAFMIN